MANERAQVFPPLDAVRLQTGTPGRPRKRPKVRATDKGYDAKALRLQWRNALASGADAKTRLEG